MLEVRTSEIGADGVAGSRNPSVNRLRQRSDSFKLRVFQQPDTPNHQKKYERAIADATDKIQSNVFDVEAYKCRAMANGKLGNYLNCISDLDEILDRVPDDAELHFHRGRFKFLIGGNDEAILDFDEAIRLGYRDVEAYIIRASANRKLGKLEEAISDIESALCMHANDFDLRKMLQAYQQEATDR